MAYVKLDELDVFCLGMQDPAKAVTPSGKTNRLCAPAETSLQGHSPVPEPPLSADSARLEGMRLLKGAIKRKRKK
jgi:hypothetical protein